MMWIMTWVEHFVLFLMFALSVWSLSIILERRRFYKNFETQEVWGQFAKTLDPILRSGSTEKSDIPRESREITALGVDRRFRSFLILEKRKLERGLTSLATLGANAPFIGLFGTVLGIIQAFDSLGISGEMSAMSGTANTVMAGVSRALIATAAGLFVAIPAVISYNVFSKRIKDIISDLEQKKDLRVSEFLVNRE